MAQWWECFSMWESSLYVAWVRFRARCHMWVEFVVGSRLAPRLRVFSRVLRFSSLHKSNISKFQFDQDRERAWKRGKADVASSLSNVICNAGTSHKSKGRNGGSVTYKYGLRRRGHTEQLQRIDVYGSRLKSVTSRFRNPCEVVSRF